MHASATLPASTAVHLSQRTPTNATAGTTTTASSSTIHPSIVCDAKTTARTDAIMHFILKSHFTLPNKTLNRAALADFFGPHFTYKSTFIAPDAYLEKPENFGFLWRTKVIFHDTISADTHDLLSKIHEAIVAVAKKHDETILPLVVSKESELHKRIEVVKDAAVRIKEIYPQTLAALNFRRAALEAAQKEKCSHEEKMAFEAATKLHSDTHREIRLIYDAITHFDYLDERYHKAPSQDSEIHHMLSEARDYAHRARACPESEVHSAREHYLLAIQDLDKACKLMDDIANSAESTLAISEDVDKRLLSISERLDCVLKGIPNITELVGQLPKDTCASVVKDCEIRKIPIFPPAGVTLV